MVGVYTQDVEPGKVLREDSGSYVKREVTELVMGRSGITEHLDPNPILFLQDEDSKVDFLIAEAQRRPVAVLGEEQDQLAPTLIKYALDNRHSICPMYPIVVGAVPEPATLNGRNWFEGPVVRRNGGMLVTIGDIGLVGMLDVPELTYEEGVRFGKGIQNVRT